MTDTTSTTGGTTGPAGSTGTPVRRAWLAVGSLAAVGMVAMGSIEAVGLASRTERTVRQSFGAEGIAVVSVSSDDGDVRVVGAVGSTDEIRVVIRLQESWRTVDRVARVDGDHLELAASCPEFGIAFCRADYEVQVPRGVRVVARSHNGDASARSVDGGVDVTSSNGDVTGDDLGGVVVLGSDNGSVDAEGIRAQRLDASSSNGNVTVGFATPPTDVRATSDNGDVIVEVPRGAALYAVDATTDNGTATTPIRTDPASDRRVVASSDNGDVDVRYP